MMTAGGTMTADGTAMVKIEATIASDVHHRASLRRATGPIVTLTTGGPAIIGGQNRTHSHTMMTAAMTAAEEAAIHTGRTSPKVTSPSAWKSQLASPTTRLPASRRKDARREGMDVAAARLAEVAGLAGSHLLTPPSGH
jgi:hypothetical protein